ncbi:hypothetical protein HYS48_01590 [Candidatus Woesearchaeota archaeon]|nr:hypothetical protein [Candidatus Woesearchaeota archaeon]
MTEEKEQSGWKSEKLFLLTIAILLLIFALFFIVQYLSRPEILTVDEMHRRNLAGELDKDVPAYVHNGFSFVQYEGLWTTQLYKQGIENIYNLQLHFGPREVEDINLLGDPMPFLNVSGLYVTFDPLGRDLGHVALAAGEFSLITAKVLNITPVPACTMRETEVCKKVDIVQCGNTTKAVVYLREAEKAGVVVEGSCITISGNQLDLVKATDTLLLKWMRII